MSEPIAATAAKDTDRAARLDDRISRSAPPPPPPSKDDVEPSHRRDLARLTTEIFRSERAGDLVPHCMLEFGVRQDVEERRNYSACRGATLRGVHVGVEVHVKNPYTQPLESFTFDEMVDALDAISSETGRLDFKEEMIPKTDLAYRACSFGNAEGGLIVVGVKDPVEGQPLEFGPLPKTDDKERLRATAQINSRVYPALPLDVMGYRSVDGTKAVLVIRIGFSTMAPHEYTGTDMHNLPVRRGTSTDRLRLGEIELLRLRRNGEPSQSPILRKFQPYVSIQPLTDSGFVGVSIAPQTYAERRRILDVADNHFIEDLVAKTRGPDDRIHGGMTARSFPDSMYLSTSDWKRPTVPVAGSVFTGPPHQIEVFSDGDIILRRAQDDQNATWQFIDMLLLSYAIAQGVTYHFALQPRIRVHVIARFDERRFKASAPPADAYEDDFTVDLAAETFTDAFCDTVMRLYRGGDNIPDRPHIRKTLDDFSRTVLPLGDKLRPRWLSG